MVFFPGVSGAPRPEEMARVSRAAGSPPGSPSERRRVRFDTSTCMAVALMVILLRTSAGAVERVAKGDAARRGRARASHRTGSSIDVERTRLAGAVGDAAWDASGDRRVRTTRRWTPP